MHHYKCGLTGKEIDGECYAMFLKKSDADTWQDCWDMGSLEMDSDKGLFQPASHIFKAWSDEIKGTFYNGGGSDPLKKYLPEGIDTENLYDLGLIFLIHKDAFEYVRELERFFLTTSNFNVIENQIRRFQSILFKEDLEFWQRQQLSTYCEAFHIHGDLMFFVLRDMKILEYALHSLGRIFMPSFHMSDVDADFEKGMLAYMNEKALLG